MGKSIRSKREKRLRAIRREIVEPIYEKKEAAKLAVQEAALAAPKLPVRPTPSEPSASSALPVAMDVEIPVGSQSLMSLKPIGKKLKKKIKIAKRNYRGKGKIRKKTCVILSANSFSRKNPFLSCHLFLLLVGGYLVFLY